MSAARMLIAAIALSPVPAAVAAAEAGPAARMAGYNEVIVGILKQRLPLKARVERFETLVDGYYDMPTIAALVVGPAWARASAADRAAVTSALRRHSAISLAQNFVKFGGERFLVDPKVQERGGSSLIKVTIASPGGSDALYFRMHRSATGDWRIVDVISGGVSQIAVQRADLAATAAAGGAAAIARRLAQVDAGSMAGR